MADAVSTSIATDVESFQNCGATAALVRHMSEELNRLPDNVTLLIFENRPTTWPTVFRGSHEQARTAKIPGTG